MKVANAAASVMLALILSLTGALGIAAAVSTPPSLMSRADYLASLRSVGDEGRLALARCRGEQPDSRALCRARARGDERVAAAQLEVRYRGTVAAKERARLVQARAAHSIILAGRLSTT